MRSSSIIAFVVLAFVSYAAHSSDKNVVQIGPHDNEVFFSDLQVLGTALGVFSESFDYELDEPHCVHFTVEITEHGEAPSHIDAGGECGLGGPHRITVQWRDKDEQVDLYFNLLHRENNSYFGGFSGPSFNKPKGPSGTSSAPLSSPADFVYDRPLELSRREFISSSVDEATQEYVRRVEVSVTVFVELRNNPAKIIGTE